MAWNTLSQTTSACALDYLYTRFKGDDFYSASCAGVCDFTVEDFDDHEVRLGAIWPSDQVITEMPKAGEIRPFCIRGSLVTGAFG